MIAPRSMITADDIKAVATFLELGSPLSGYLAGNPFGGPAVQRLEEIWKNKFKRQHAICCNSATSGLLAACIAMEFGRNTLVDVPALSMSATAAVPHWLGATLQWTDCDDHGGAVPSKYNFSHDAIVTTLFGHPVDFDWMHRSDNVILDNAQGILSRYDHDNLWSENIATVCVTSFNVHKQVNAGEMGIITTDDADLAARMRGFINHGENPWPGHEDIGGGVNVGLNLRPTEISAVLVLSQLARIDETIGNLQLLAARLTDNMPFAPTAFVPIGPREGTQSAWYCYAFRVPADRRDAIVAHLNNNGVPCSAMYQPLYRLPALSGNADVMINAERLSRATIVFELCAWRYEDDITNVAQQLAKAATL